MVGGLKGGKGLAQWRKVRRAVALQLGDTEPAVQQAALRCLKVDYLCISWQGFQLNGFTSGARQIKMQTICLPAFGRRSRSSS